MKSLVALDLDDLIFPLMETLVPYANERLDKSLAIEDFYSFEFENIWGGTRMDSVALIETFFEEMQDAPGPIKGASDAIGKLSSEFTLAIITSRTDSMRTRTLDWLETHFPATFVEVHLTNNYVTDNRPTKRRKADVCLELGAIALVDDGFENVAKAAEVGVKGLLYGDFPWNRAYELPEGVARVADWNAVVDELLGML